MTPAEIGAMMTEAFGEEKGREIVEAIVGLAVDDGIKAQQEYSRKIWMEAMLAPQPTTGPKKRWWHR